MLAWGYHQYSFPKAVNVVLQKCSYLWTYNFLSPFASSYLLGNSFPTFQAALCHGYGLGAPNMESCIRATAKIVLSIPAKTAHHHPKHPTTRTLIQQWPLLWHWPVSICKDRVGAISSSCSDPFLALFLEQEARIHTSLNFRSINPALTFREAQTYHSKQLWSMFPLQGYLPQVQSGHSGKGLSRKENTGFEGCVCSTSTPNILKQT